VSKSAERGAKRQQNSTIGLKKSPSGIHPPIRGACFALYKTLKHNFRKAY